MIGHVQTKCDCRNIHIIILLKLSVDCGRPLCCLIRGLKERDRVEVFCAKMIHTRKSGMQSITSYLTKLAREYAISLSPF